jgi:hypothetical protein
MASGAAHALAMADDRSMEATLIDTDKGGDQDRPPLRLMRDEEEPEAGAVERGSGGRHPSPGARRSRESGEEERGSGGHDSSSATGGSRGTEPGEEHGSGARHATEPGAGKSVLGGRPSTGKEPSSASPTGSHPLTPQPRGGSPGGATPGGTRATTAVMPGSGGATRDLCATTTVPPAGDGEAQKSEVLTVPELAVLLRLKAKSVYAILSRDATAIPGCRRVGRAWRAHRSTVVAWLAGQNSDARPRKRGG